MLEFGRECLKTGPIRGERRLALVFAALLVNLSEDLVRGKARIIEDEERVVWVFAGKRDWLSQLASATRPSFEMLSFFGGLRAMQLTFLGQLFREPSQ